MEKTIHLVSAVFPDRIEIRTFPSTMKGLFHAVRDHNDLSLCHNVRDVKHERRQVRVPISR